MIIYLYLHYKCVSREQTSFELATYVSFVRNF